MVRDSDSLPFPPAYYALAVNGAKGGATKYLTLQFLNYARWTAQEHSVGLLPAVRIMFQRNMRGVDGAFRPLGFLSMWRPSVTLWNEAVHWGMKVTLTVGLYEQLRADLGRHGGLLVGVALNTGAEVIVTGPTERFGAHMAMTKTTSYWRSYEMTRLHRPNSALALWNGGGGLFVRNFSWNYTFFEWKRAMHNALDQPGYGPAWLEPHFQWLRRMEPKDAANILTFEAANLATYLTFFNMAGDNIKTKMTVDPDKFRTVRYTVAYIYREHGLLGFARGGLFKGLYLVAGATVAIGIQERLTTVMAKLLE
mmetsp:Transcript_119055/g.237400  ORF Transcript_119055/g.237400 Transcript_119055/m.237400 type:complete len:309 (+) Transcript_119055:96-1022(+)|eukprot:CAMPEP_0172923522 /NCGR_PEP_ID=MMETSP1075-20121228/209895_1 /TAXON_ID=2916 /ORGANISM="Ceratium fusus, Strain PA161109" /LENGTH=308 /DNA_ID=CAMNT_0013784023 /DNA_START=14 /DNA_END=940 /DNA_ORIENTATION=-